MAHQSCNLLSKGLNLDVPLFFFKVHFDVLLYEDVYGNGTYSTRSEVSGVEAPKGSIQKVAS